MKILLLGNYSGVSIALKEGLEKLGQDVTLASNGDGYKKFSGADVQIYRTNVNSTILDKLKAFIFEPLMDSRFQGYDVVQVISPEVYPWFLLDLPLKRILKKNRKVYMSNPGVDYYLYQAWKKKEYAYDYYMFNDNPELCSFYDGKSIVSKALNYTCKKIRSNVKGNIPLVPYEYELPYKRLNNLCTPILFPINIDNIQYKENIVLDRIVFFHGINRYKDKGSQYICEAMKIIEKKYPKNVECIVVERLPYNEYIKKVEEANVILDQCKSFGYGINACISMAQGKVVMSGAEHEVIADVKGKCPVINIRPNTEQIVESMEWIIKNKDEIVQIGNQSRKYIEQNHNYIDIAKQYLEIWSNV